MIIPQEIKNILNKLQKEGYEAYVVGGSLRDLILKKKPKDWDICTNAKPKEIQKIFPDSFYENTYGTVTVKTQSQDLELKNIEITTYRIDEQYTDKRHPDQVSFTSSLEEDLSRRDFTVNAMASDGEKIIDPFNGQVDLEKRIIKAVGKPNQRFEEDALRMIRAVRLATELGFEIEKKTAKAIKENAGWLRAIAKERIRDEFVKMIMSPSPDRGIQISQEKGILTYIIPELEKGVGVSQNRHHIYTIYQHAVLALKFAAERNYDLEVRLAALLHDIAKPQTKEGEGPDSTFYNHDILGAKYAVQILNRLRFPGKVVEKVAHLVRYHMFVYDVDEVTEAGVRRLLRKVGPAYIDDLIKVRIADRLGSGCPKAVPYKLRHLQYVIEKVSSDPISVKMLKIDGTEIMDLLKIKPSPKIGLILSALLSEVLDDPQKNTKGYLNQKAQDLSQLNEKELKTSIRKIKEKKEEVDLKMKKRYFVK